MYRKAKKTNNQCEQKAIFSQVHISIADSVITKNKYATGKLSFAGFKDCFSEEIEVSIKGRGNTSWSFPKRSYQIKFTDTTTFLSLPAGNKFVLIANYSDKSMLRNELAFSLSRLSELNWTPKSQFVELTVNKEYIGVYQLIQKIEIAENALNSNKTDVLLEIDHKERLHPE